jgi:hypothetical protein
MTPPALVRLSVARELLVVAIVEHALDVLAAALEVEHPTLTNPNEPDSSPTLRRARAVLRGCHHLRHRLHAYRAAVDLAISAPETDLDDFPF